MQWKLGMWVALFATVSVFAPRIAAAQSDEVEVQVEAEDGPDGEQMLWIQKRRGGEGPEMGEERGEMFRGRPGPDGRGRAHKMLGNKVREHMKDPEVRKIMKAKQEAHQKVKKLVQVVREGKGDKKKAEADLKEALGAAFDADLAAHEVHLKRMETEIVKLKSRISKRRGMKAKIIDKKIGELAGEEEGWEW